jgi:folate-dependent phosphoribosylglycinamide formyltransferase PurN
VGGVCARQHHPNGRHVIPQVDRWAVVAVQPVPIVAGETVEALAQRVHMAEHVLLVEGIAKVLSEL